MGLNFGFRGEEEDALFSVLAGSLRASREVSWLSPRFGPPATLNPVQLGVRKRVRQAARGVIRGRCKTKVGKTINPFIVRTCGKGPRSFACLPLYTRPEQWGCSMYDWLAGQLELCTWTIDGMGRLFSNLVRRVGTVGWEARYFYLNL